MRSEYPVASVEMTSRTAPAAELALQLLAQVIDVRAHGADGGGRRRPVPELLDERVHLDDVVGAHGEEREQLAHLGPAWPVRHAAADGLQWAEDAEADAPVGF